VIDSLSGLSVSIAAPFFLQLCKRGWAVQDARVHTVRTQSGRETRYIARLVDWLSLRSAKTTAEGNLQFRSLLDSTGASIRSWWEEVEKAWALDPRSHCPHTLEEVEALKQERLNEILAECSRWGVPEAKPVRTGVYLTPDDAALAIKARQA
jgi:hypothetical protein